MHGILLQLPLPDHLDQDEFIALIDPGKDVDGLTSANAGLLMQDREEAMVPCTPAGVMELLREAEVELEGARAVVIGRSILVGKPLAQLLLAANATVTHCHSRTRDLPAVCREADVLIAAVGSPGLVTGEMVREGAVVIDVGTNRTDDGLVGDVDFEAVRERARGDHAGAGRGGADDAGDAAGEHAARRPPSGLSEVRLPVPPDARGGPTGGGPSRWQPAWRSDVASQRVAGKHRPSLQAGQGFPRGGPPFRPPLPATPAAGGGGAGTEPGVTLPARWICEGSASANGWRRRPAWRCSCRCSAPSWYEPSASGWESLAAIDVLLAFVAATGCCSRSSPPPNGVPAVPIAPPRWYDRRRVRRPPGAVPRDRPSRTARPDATGRCGRAGGRGGHRRRRLHRDARRDPAGATRPNPPIPARGLAMEAGIEPEHRVHRRVGAAARRGRRPLAARSSQRSG